VEALAAHDFEGRRVLIPRAAVARDLLPVELARRGAKVDVVEAYRTVVPKEAFTQAREIFELGKKPDWITFTSSSTVQNLLKLIPPQALAGVKVASIGPVTSASARQLGINVTAEAPRYTIDGLVESILASL